MAGTDLSPSGILKFVGEEEGASIIDWAGTEAFKAIIGVDDLSEVKAALDTIIANQEKILNELKNVIEEIDWQGGLTRAFAAEENIKVLMQRLSDIVSLPDPAHRKADALLLQAALLDDRSGMMANLFQLNDVLLGQSVTDPAGKGLLQLWAEKCYTQYQNLSSISLQNYSEQIDNYLAGVFHLQFQGLTLYCAAATEDDAKILVKRCFDNLTQQQAKMMAHVSPATALVLNSPRGWFALMRPNANTCVYGSTATGTYLDFSIYERDRHGYNTDEAFRFNHQADGTYKVCKQTDPADSYVANHSICSKADVAARFKILPMTIDTDPHTAFVRVIDVVDGTDLLVSNGNAIWQLSTTDVDQTYNSDQ